MGTRHGDEALVLTLRYGQGQERSESASEEVSNADKITHA